MKLSRIQVQSSLRTHRKSLRLGAKLRDPRAYLRVLDLWLWVAEVCPEDGIIRGADAVDVIEAAVGWTAEPGGFVRAAMETGFLDQTNDGIAVHDWSDYNGSQLKKLERDRKRMSSFRTVTNSSPRRRGEVVATVATTSPAKVEASERTLVLSVQDAKPPRVRKLSHQQEFYSWAMTERARVFPLALPDVVLAPTLINARLKEPLKLAGEPGLKRGWLAYMATDWAKSVCSPPAAFGPFLSQWSRHVDESARERKLRAGELIGPEHMAESYRRMEAEEAARPHPELTFEEINSHILGGSK